jgi:hypothetical protein
MWVAWMKAPAVVDGLVLQQPFHRPFAGPDDTILHLFHLFGDVDVDRRLWHRAMATTADKLFRRGRAQTVWRDTDDCMV